MSTIVEVWASQLGAGGSALWVFMHGTDIADRGLIVLFFGLFCYFSVFFLLFPPPRKISADPLAWK